MALICYPRDEVPLGVYWYDDWGAVCESCAEWLHGSLDNVLITNIPAPCWVCALHVDRREWAKRKWVKIDAAMSEFDMRKVDAAIAESLKAWGGK